MAVGPDDDVCGVDDDFGDFGLVDGDGVDFDDCGLRPDGQCSMAGTEWCDWDCGRLDQ